MAGRQGGTLIAILVVLGLMHSAAATTYAVNVPGSNNGGWGFVTSRNSTSYDDTFKNTQLFVGDILTFTFADNVHDVYEVSPADTLSCNFSSPIHMYTTTVNVALDTAGQHGFICSFPSHCVTFGMHLLVTVRNGAPSGPASGPTSEPHNAASFLRAGSGMIVGALIAASALLAL